MGILNPNTGGALEGYNRQEKFDLDQKISQANLFSKIQDIKESRYDFAEKRARRNVRDVKADAEVSALTNAKLRAEQDTDQRKVAEALQHVQQALQTNDPSSWENAIQAMGDANPNYKSVLEQTPPEDRRDRLGELMMENAKNLEMTQKGMLLGMKGQQDRATVSARGAEARQTQQALLQSREGIADADRMSREDIASRSGSGLTQVFRDIAERDPALAYKLEQEYIKSIVTKNTMTKGAASAIKQQEHFDKTLNTAMKAVTQSLTSTYSGDAGNVQIDKPEEWMEIPGFDAMRQEGTRLVEQRGYTANQTHDWLTNHYILLDANRGFIKMPTNPDGSLMGGVSANDLLKAARNPTQRMLDSGIDDLESVVEMYKQSVKKQYNYDWTN